MASKLKRSIQMSEGELSDRTSNSSDNNESQQPKRVYRNSRIVARFVPTWIVTSLLGILTKINNLILIISFFSKKMREDLKDSSESDSDEEWSNKTPESNSSSSDSDDWSPSRSPSRKRPVSIFFLFSYINYCN